MKNFFLYLILYLSYFQQSFAQTAHFRLTIDDPEGIDSLNIDSFFEIRISNMDDLDDILLFSADKPSLDYFAAEGIYRISPLAGISDYIFLENGKILKAKYNIKHREFIYENDHYPRLLTTIEAEYDMWEKKILSEKKMNKQLIAEYAFDEYVLFILNIDNPIILDWAAGYLFSLGNMEDESRVSVQKYEQFLIKISQKFPGYPFEMAKTGYRSRLLDGRNSD